ncbi:MAG: 30S ribosomal protein S18 [Bacteriovoracaceae bacterium]
MIYETAYALRPEAGEDAIQKVAAIVKEVVADVKGEILVEDQWGVRTYAQPTSSGATKGNYFYFMYKGDTQVNTEIERRFNISEDVEKFIFVRLGEDKDQERIVKAYKNPSHGGRDEEGRDSEKEKKMFQKRKSCYFSAKKTEPDWKDPSSYAWLVNEFGKISPARVTGLRPKFQRMATTAIKRGRCMGLISHLSNNTAR